MTRQRTGVGLVVAGLLSVVAPLSRAQSGAAPGTTTVAASRADSLAAARAAVSAAGPALTGFYPVPDIPAAALLNVSPGTVSRPGSMKDLAVGLLNGIGADGRSRQGFAVEASSALLRLFRVTLDQYQQSAAARLRARLSLSFATVQSSGDTGSTDLAWGVRLPLWDNGDVLADSGYTRRLGAELLSCAPAAPPAGIPVNDARGDSDAARTADGDSAARAKQMACMHKLATVKELSGTAGAMGEAAAARGWNVRRAFVAYAGSGRFPRAAFTNYAYAADRLWMSAAFPLVPIVQAVAYADLTHHHAVRSSAAFNTAAVGGRMNVGSARVNGFAELLGEAAGGSAVPRRSTEWSAGLEFLPVDGLWISTGIGRRAADALSPAHTLVIATLHWSFAGKAFFDPTRT